MTNKSFWVATRDNTKALRHEFKPKFKVGDLVRCYEYWQGGVLAGAPGTEMYMVYKVLFKEKVVSNIPEGLLEKVEAPTK